MIEEPREEVQNPWDEPTNQPCAKDKLLDLLQRPGFFPNPTAYPLQNLGLIRLAVRPLMRHSVEGGFVHD